MLKNFIVSGIFLVNILSNINQYRAQEGIITSFLRPTIVDMYGISHDNELENIALKNLTKSSNPLKRFDKLNVNTSKLVLNLPQLPKKPILPIAPKKPDSTAKKKEITLYNKQLALLRKDKLLYQKEIKIYNKAVDKRNNIKKKQIDQFIKNSSKDIIGKWFLRDSVGNMNFQLLIDRAHFSASDLDVNQAKFSAVNRISSLGEKLIKKTYVILHTIENVSSYKEYYDNKDRENKTLLKYQKGEINPVFREKEGFLLKNKSYLFKLNFNDTISMKFMRDYWVSESTKEERDSKINSWKDAVFPVQFLSSYNYQDEKSQYTEEYYLEKIKKEPALKIKYKKAISKRVPIENLKRKIGQKNFTASVLKANLKKIEDFKLKASVHDAYPISSKIGLKEGVKKHERWAIYEIHLDEKGKQIKKKTGYARIVKVANNDSVSSGASPTSIFRQHGGKATHSGMLIEPKHGGVVGIGLGVMNNPSNKSLSGFHADLDFRLFSKYKIGLTYTGNSFKIGLNEFGMLQREEKIFKEKDSLEYEFSNVLIMNSDTLYDIDGNDTINTITEAKGSTQHISINVGREFLIGNRGNFIIEPKLGVGLSTYQFDTIIAPNDLRSILSSEELKSLYQLNTLTSVLSIEFGVHILPNLIFSIKPTIINRGVYQTTATLKPDTENSDYRKVEMTFDEAQQINNNWGFGSLNSKSTSYPIYFGIKLKL